MVEIIAERLARVTTLDEGSHSNISKGICAMEAVAYIAGEPWSDHPVCACPVISSFMRAWNDGLPDADRTRLLLPLVPRLIGTRSTKQVEERRAMMAADWLVRVNTPAWLRLAGLTAQADRLEALPEVVSMAQVPSIRGPIEAARDDAVAAWAARAAVRDAARDARDAVRAAAWDAARAAARAAAWEAARDAARAAAWEAAWDAAWDAARAAALDARAAALDARAALDAAWSALKPTVDRLQTSAVALVERMIAAEQAGG